MSRFLRWKYVLPRLALVSVLVLTVHFGLDPLLRWTLVASGETAVGAKVELAELETSLLDGQLTVRNLAVANPQSPMKNLLQADLARFEIDTAALLHRRLVVQDGTIQGLQFDTPRTTSGALPEQPEEEQEATPSWIGAWTESLGDQSAQWFEQLGDSMEKDLAAQLQTPHVAQQLQKRWQEQVTALRAEVEALRTQGKALQQEIRGIRKNPLRHLERLGELQRELVAAQNQIKAIQAKITKLPQQTKEDRLSLAAAVEYDRRFVRQQLQLGQLDGDQLTDYLLGQEANKRLASVLQWVGKARSMVPRKPRVARSRGTNVLFSSHLKPRWHVQQLNLQGNARLSGQPVELTGSLTDLSSHPQRLSEPTRLKLASTGGGNMRLEVVLDRRSGAALDTLHLEYPQLLLPGRTLGDASRLAVAIDPGTVSLRADIRLEEDRLSGEILLVQQSVRLTLPSQAARNGRLAGVLEQALASVESMEAKLVLSGTLRSPKLKIQSDLGPQLASSFNQGVQRLIQQQSEALLAESQRIADRQLAVLARKEVQEKLLAKLGDNQQLVSQLASLAGGGNSLPKLGRSLRLGLQRK